MADKLEMLSIVLEKRYRQKKILNIFICIIIIALSVFSLIYMQNTDKEGILVLRWMTVDGTIFTLILTTFCLIVNHIEIIKRTELTRKAVYMTRLSSAVAESLIMIVVLISQLPIFNEHMHIARPDMFCMHLAIPVLVVVSFTLNDSPYGKLTKIEIFHGTAYITFYSIIIITLILSNVIKEAYIPYSFLNVRHMSLPIIIITVISFYVTAFFLSALLSYMNRKLYWGWYKIFRSR